MAPCHAIGITVCKDAQSSHLTTFNTFESRTFIDILDINRGILGLAIDLPQEWPEGVCAL